MAALTSTRARLPGKQGKFPHIWFHLWSDVCLPWKWIKREDLWQDLPKHRHIIRERYLILSFQPPSEMLETLLYPLWISPITKTFPCPKIHKSDKFLTNSEGFAQVIHFEEVSNRICEEIFFNCKSRSETSLSEVFTYIKELRRQEYGNPWVFSQSIIQICNDNDVILYSIAV